MTPTTKPNWPAVVLIEVADVVFALDSVSTTLAVSRRVFVLYASNILAVLGLRALFAVVAVGLAGVRALEYGVALLVFLAAVKLAISARIRVPLWVTATTVTVVFVGLAVAALTSKRKVSHA